ncbi:MAG: hypothetical protein A2Z99_15590 [Treponema sp. GWB1_62_6]|nr:MAG: hypothetical protein A2Z99_15590 [Treponema sp. GWB1_62_6]OHE65525.1 MAG: hypothetical protein A2001_10375 [Treponema sp. GWC1_61_84]
MLKRRAVDAAGMSGYNHAMKKRTGNSRTALLPVLYATLALTAVGCPSLGARPFAFASPPEKAAEEDRERKRVVESARELLGRKPNEKVTVRGRVFMLDCIGTVSAAYWGAGYDLQRDFAKHGGNGVLRLHSSLKAWGALHELKETERGDIVFWANTYDRNEDGKMGNDGITHAGIVVQADEDGTIHYLHASVTRGVVIAYFNLRHPDVAKSPAGKIWNSPMYLGSNYGLANNPPHWLSGDLWSSFGDAEKTARELGSGGKGT